MAEPLFLPELHPYQLSCSKTLDILQVNPKTGLQESDARSRLADWGPNELPEEPPEPAWKKFIAQFRDPLTLLLLIATVISFVACVAFLASSFTSLATTMNPSPYSPACIASSEAFSISTLSWEAMSKIR